MSTIDGLSRLNGMNLPNVEGTGNVRNLTDSDTINGGKVPGDGKGFAVGDQYNTIITNNNNTVVSNNLNVESTTINNIYITQVFSGIPNARGSLGAVSDAVKGGNNQMACDKFGAFVKDIHDNGMPVDVNALVQQVLRESYLDTTEDLKFYADKVKYFNEAKKMTREYVQDLRDFKTGLSTELKDKGFCLSSPPSDKAELEKFNSIVTNYCNEHRTASKAGGTAETSAISSAYASALAEAEAALCSGPEIKSGDITKGKLGGKESNIIQIGEYKVETNVPKGDETIIYNKKGEIIVDIWGDPHVCEGHNKHDTGADNTWNFTDDSTFILPNGAKLCLNTEPNDNGEYVTVGIDILSGQQHVALGRSDDGVKNDKAKLSNDRAAWDKTHADAKNDGGAGVFALKPGKKEWARLMDDGKFHDIKTSADGNKWKEFKKAENRTIVTDGDNDVADVGDQVWMAARSTGALQNAGNNVGDFGFSNNIYADTEAGRMASDIGLPNTIPPIGCNSAEELDNQITKFEEKLSTIGDDAQLANTDLQNILQKQQQTLQMMSNISKMLSDTALAVIRKIG